MENNLSDVFSQCKMVINFFCCCTTRMKRSSNTVQVLCIYTLVATEYLWRRQNGSSLLLFRPGFVL